MDMPDFRERCRQNKYTTNLPFCQGMLTTKIAYIDLLALGAASFGMFNRKFENGVEITYIVPAMESP